MGARASSWSAGINPPRSNCLDGAQGAVQPCVWYAFTLRTRHYGAAVKWGEAPRYVLELRSHVATRGRPDAFASRRLANGQSLVSRSSGARGQTVGNPSRTRRLTSARGHCTACVYGAATDWVPRGHRAESRVWGTLSVAQCTVGPTLRTPLLACESSLRH